MSTTNQDPSLVKTLKSNSSDSLETSSSPLADGQGQPQNTAVPAGQQQRGLGGGGGVGAGGGGPTLVRRRSSTLERLSASFRRSFNLGRSMKDFSYPFEKFEVTTPDGWRLCLKYYPPNHPDGLVRQHPALLCHGLSGNHMIFDIQRDKSMTAALREKGYHVWLVDLRGSGLSEGPSSKKAVNWDMMAYVNDAKCAMDYVLGHHKVDQLHFVGHSLGGIIGYVLLVDPKSRSNFRSMTNLATSVEYCDSAFKNIKSVLLPLTDMIDMIDLRALSKVYAPFVVWPSFLAHMTNVKRTTLQKILTKVELVPTALLKDLASAVEESGLVLKLDGVNPVAIKERLQEIDVPVLALAADMDVQCTTRASRSTLEAVGTRRKRFIVVGPKPLHEHHYGHLDIVIGKNGSKEVFPHIINFFLEIDDPLFVASSPLGLVHNEEFSDDEGEGEDESDSSGAEEEAIEGLQMMQSLDREGSMTDPAQEMEIRRALSKVMSSSGKGFDNGHVTGELDQSSSPLTDSQGLPVAEGKVPKGGMIPNESVRAASTKGSTYGFTLGRLGATLRNTLTTKKSLKDSLTPYEYQRFDITTTDGWRLCLKYYTPNHPDGLVRQHPVLLCHGLGGNHMIFDLQRDKSLTGALRDKGYHVWLVDLRGAGFSEKSSSRRKGLNWDMMSHINDARCAIDHILGHHKVDQVHFGGHSMGGIIGYVLLTDPTARPKFRSMFNLATSLEYIDSSYRAMKPLLPLTEVMDFLDLRSVMKIYAPFVVWPSMLAHMTNVKRSTLQKVLNEMELVPTALLKDLATAIEEKGLILNVDGTGPVVIRERLHEIDVPVLALSADMDKQCSIRASRSTLEGVGSQQKRFIVIGPKPAHKHHYAHLDILVGKNAYKEVFPHVTDFLLELDDPSFKPTATPLTGRQVFSDNEDDSSGEEDEAISGREVMDAIQEHGGGDPEKEEELRRALSEVLTPSSVSQGGEEGGNRPATT